VLNIVKG